VGESLRDGDEERRVALETASRERPVAGSKGLARVGGQYETVGGDICLVDRQLRTTRYFGAAECEGQWNEELTHLG
jgi:hypothetical protein